MLPWRIPEIIPDDRPASAARSPDARDLPAAPPVKSDSRAPLPTAPVILVADDNEINLLVACSLIKSLGFNTETAANGRGVIELAATKHYAAILLDYHMPVMDGCAATAALRSQEGPNKAIPIIGLSASLDGRKRCLSVGMNYFLAKPIRLSELKDILENVTRTYQQRPG